MKRTKLYKKIPISLWQIINNTLEYDTEFHQKIHASIEKRIKESKQKDSKNA